MPLLDRFRRPPQWKHEDPLVRIAGVEELPLDQQDLLIKIAREDADARVRRAAVKKIIDTTVLADVAAKDHDEGVREEAGGILRDVALGVYENATEAESLAAVPLLPDPRFLVTVAEAASLETVRAAALARIDDPHLLSTVARRAAEPGTRFAALARLTDTADLCAVALKAEHKDVALAAVERLTDRDALRTVAGRAVSKAVSRRARALVDGLEPKERPEVDASVAAAPAASPSASRQLDLCRLAEALAKSPASADVPARLARTEAMWAELGADVDEESERRFRAACANTRMALTQAEAERAERERTEAEVAAATAERTALCGRVAAIDGEDALTRLGEARAVWQAMSAFPRGHDVEALALVRRFEDACGACERRFARWLAGRALRERAEQTCIEADRIADGVAFPEALTRWAAVQRTWRDHVSAGLSDESLQARLSEAEARLRAREAAAREAADRQRQANLDRLSRLADRVDRLVAAPTLTLKDAERAARDLRDALDRPPSLPQRQDADNMARRLRALHECLAPKVQELREIDEWQRWANAGIQERLCQRVEALAAAADATDAADAARQLREIQEEWRKASLVPREKAQVLWARFKAASDVVRARCDAHFTQQAEQRAANLARKEALCKQAEALAESSDWIRTADAIKALQADWKGIGPVPRGEERALWERFRAACDRFFTRRHEDLARRKEEWAANLLKKQALCERIEALADSTDWERGLDEVRRAQAEWKGIGPVRKNRADTIWERFRGACDRFYQRSRERDNAKLAALRAEREALCAELEQLANPTGGLPSGTASLPELNPPVPDARTEPVPSESLTAASPDGAVTLPSVVEPAVAASVLAGTTLGVQPDAAAVPLEDVADRVQRARARWLELDRSDTSSAGGPNPLAERFASALERAVERHTAAFAGTPLDPAQTREAMVELCNKAEGVVASLRPPQDGTASPAAVLAQQLREALAANTIGGRAAAAEREARWREAGDAVREAQAKWQALGPVPGEAGRSLARRFQRACHRFAQQRDRELHVVPPRDGPPRAPRGMPPQPGRGR